MTVNSQDLHHVEGSLTTGGYSMGGWSLGNRQDQIIGGFHHGRALALSPYHPESFDGIVKNKLPGKLFFFIIKQFLCNVRITLYPGASQYIANWLDSSWFFVGF